jgi:hypothetical protein
MSSTWPEVNLRDWVANASANLQWKGFLRVPVSIALPSREKNASYIFSPRSAWFDYLAHECRSQPLLALLIQTLGKLAFFLGIDRTIFVGNYPISTSIWSSEQEHELHSIANEMRHAHPNHYVGIRNLLPHRHPALITQLQSQGFCGIPSRVIYEFDFRYAAVQIPSHLKRDLALFKKLQMQVEITTKLDQIDLLRIEALYQKIYLEKHSLLNPQYTQQFFEDVVRPGVMSCLLVRNSSGQICSFALLQSTHQTLTVPALGYDPALDLEGSYRVLFAAIYSHAKEERALLNYSSGAGDFKRKRGASAYLEYTFLASPISGNCLQRKILKAAANKSLGIKAQDLIKLGA